VCVVLSCVDRGLAMGRSPVQGALPKFLNAYISSEVNHISEEAVGPKCQVLLE